MVKVIDFLLASLYPLIYAISWGIVVYEHIKYKTRIKEIEDFKAKWQPILEAWLVSKKTTEV